MKTTKVLLVLLILAVACYAKSTMLEGAVLLYKAQFDKVYIKVIRIDKCEYIVTDLDTYQGGVSIIHKQNCSNCKPLKVKP